MTSRDINRHNKRILIAKLRRAGNSWRLIAKQLGCSQESCRSIYKRSVLNNSIKTAKELLEARAQGPTKQ